jgi:hypothetical protein
MILTFGYSLARGMTSDGTLNGIPLPVCTRTGTFNFFAVSNVVVAPGDKPISK